METIFVCFKTLFFALIPVSLCECLVIKELQKQRISFDSHKYAPPFFCLSAQVILKKYYLGFFCLRSSAVESWRWPGEIIRAERGDAGSNPAADTIFVSTPVKPTGFFVFTPGNQTKDKLKKQRRSWSWGRVRAWVLKLLRFFGRKAVSNRKTDIGYFWG